MPWSASEPPNLIKLCNREGSCWEDIGSSKWFLFCFFPKKIGIGLIFFIDCREKEYSVPLSNIFFLFQTIEHSFNSIKIITVSSVKFYIIKYQDLSQIIYYIKQSVKLSLSYQRKIYCHVSALKIFVPKISCMKKSTHTHWRRDLKLQKKMSWRVQIKSSFSRRKTRSTRFLNFSYSSNINVEISCKH